MLSVLEPPDQKNSDPEGSRITRARSFDEGAAALIAALQDERGKQTTEAVRTRHGGDSERNPDLTRLRLVAVTGSFLSAVSTLGFCSLAFASDAKWPLIGVCTVSAAATAAILIFYTALRRSVARRALLLQTAPPMNATLQSMAAEHVSNMEAARLLRCSEDNPQLADAILVEIIREYTDAERSRTSPPAEVPSERRRAFSSLVGNAVKPAHQNHLITRTLRRIASDVSGTS
ncbi:hypothetical protein [Streptomyces eurocidicus]|uniref:hypothetical protein n=1 Tax=Streptomyces eurocidicus TaxID=66423 RepID=UPI001C888E0B|nr:hypothetical protein [Streptomyces eurocidicus]